MKPSRHIAVSFSLGLAVWLFTKSLYAGFICFFSGVLLDIDHIIEYIVHFGWRNFTLKKCYQECERIAKKEIECQFKKIYLIFHSTEIAFVLWLITLYTKDIYLFAAALGYSTHLILDYMGNRVYPYAYFIIWRAMNDFSTAGILRRQGRSK